MWVRILAVAAIFACVPFARGADVVTQAYTSTEPEAFDNSNNTTRTAGPLFYAAGSSPAYFWSGDVDYYRIDVRDVPSTLTVHVDGIESLFGLDDPEAWLETTTGTILAHSDDIAPGMDGNLNCFFGYVFTKRGDYYVRVQRSWKWAWEYNLSNYYLYGEYKYRPPDAVPINRWSLYR